MAQNKPNAQFWSGKRVLITGHTGFKGAWLSLWLDRLGAKVGGVSLAPSTSPNLFDAANVSGDVAHTICDIRDARATAIAVSTFKPDIVFHLAAQALVRPSYDDPVETFSTNVMGTVHILDAIYRTQGVSACVVATTDKVYRNDETGRAYNEAAPLGGHDPYSASKAASEMVVESYRKSFFNDKNIALSAARAGNAIGGGDWSDERLLPDAIKAWQRGETLMIRRPDAVRPWQHVLEPLWGYIKLAEVISEQPKLSTNFNFGPNKDDIHCVRNVVEHARNVFGKGQIQYQSQISGPHEAGLLSLDNSKARQDLLVAPRWSTNDAIEKTMSWYQRFYEGDDARALCISDIEEFEATS